MSKNAHFIGIFWCFFESDGVGEWERKIDLFFVQEQKKYYLRAVNLNLMVHPRQKHKPMINVFHIVSNKHWTGAEQYTYDLVDRLRNDDDFYVEVVCRKHPNVLKQYRRLEIPISILPLKGVTDIDSPVRFARLLRKGKNIIHVHSFRDAFMAVMARRISENRDTRVVVSVHGVYKPKSNYMYTKLYKSIDCFVFSSEMARVAFLGKAKKQYADRGIVLRDSVCDSQIGTEVPDLRRELNLDSHQALIMYHGKIAAEKGLDTLLSALTHVDKAKYHLAIIGDGQPKYKAKIKGFIVANGLVLFGAHILPPSNAVPRAIDDGCSCWDVGHLCLLYALHGFVHRRHLPFQDVLHERGWQVVLLCGLHVLRHGVGLRLFSIANVALPQFLPCFVVGFVLQLLVDALQGQRHIVVGIDFDAELFEIFSKLRLELPYDFVAFVFGSVRLLQRFIVFIQCRRLLVIDLHGFCCCISEDFLSLLFGCGSFLGCCLQIFIFKIQHCHARNGQCNSIGLHQGVELCCCAACLQCGKFNGSILQVDTL